MRTRLSLLVLGLLLFAPAGALKSSAQPVPDRKWKWYYTVFNGPSYSAPTVFWGSATVVRKGSSLQIDLEENPPNREQKAPSFHGTIDANNRIIGKLDGLLLEDPRAMHGEYHSLKDGCLTETVVLQENKRRENVLSLLRATPAWCGLVW